MNSLELFNSFFLLVCDVTVDFTFLKVNIAKLEQIIQQKEKSHSEEASKLAFVCSFFFQSLTCDLMMILI